MLRMPSPRPSVISIGRDISYFFFCILYAVSCILSSMIAHLSGTLLRKAPNSVIIDNSGIGYEVTVPLSTFYALPEKDEKVSLHIYTHVREDALMLFGFYTPLEKEIFTMLISVSGIGPKLATNILSGI